MMPGGVTELVWHFFGHLRLHDDIARDRLLYEDPAPPWRPEDYKTDRPNFDKDVDLDEFSTNPLRPPEIALLEDHFDAKFRPLKPLSLPSSDDDIHPPERLPGSPAIRPGGGGGGGGGSHHEIKVSYEDGGEQSEVQIRQLNVLSDNDLLLPDGDDPSIILKATAINAETAMVLEELADGANQAISSEWWIPQTGEGVTGFVEEFDQHRAEQGGTPDANSVAPGYYLNGELQMPQPPPPNPVLGSSTPPDNAPVKPLGSFVEAGDNTAFNGALIVDFGESGRSMIVMGDYFHTNAIFQTNSIVDRDHVAAGGAEPSAIQTGDNTTDNIADFIQHPGPYHGLPATFAGPHWNVDVVHGDYYDIHTVVQTNYFMDNDIISVTGGDNHQQFVTGGNEQGNLAQIFDGSIHYDLIIVAGTYHGLNVIFQNNILLDDDVAKLLSGGSETTQSVVAGQNALLNAATIESWGNDNFLDMNDGLSKLVAELAGGATSLDPSTGALLPGSGGSFDVLYITGDYYDINAIWQNNIASDVDVIVSYLGSPSPEAAALHPDDDGTQSVVAGQNKLTNEAIIADVGPTNAYVGGEVYGDTILVQANLLPSDLDHGLVKDTKALVSELVAFVSEAQDDAHTPLPVFVPPAQDDAMANILH